MSVKPTHRTMWMIPRNIRRIEPWKIVQIANLIYTCTQDLKDQDVQNSLYDGLVDLGIKIPTNKAGIRNPGGLRTYLAQLACLGLFWKSSDTSYELTHAGEMVIKGEDPLTVLRYQLLRMQYPSVYGLGHNVAVSPKLKVKPFVFLLKLLQDPSLECRLSSREMAVAVVYGRTDKDYEKVVDKILRLREKEDFSSIVDTVDDLRTPRRFNPDAPQEDLDKGIDDAITIGNTFKNYLEAVMLIAPVYETQGKRSEAFYEVNSDPKVLSLIDRLSSEKIEPLDRDYGAAWQQRYGRYDQTKAVRSLGSKSKTHDGLSALVTTQFISAVQEENFSFDIRQFIQKAAQRWSKSEDEISRLITPLKPKIRSVARTTLEKAALSGGAEAITLEKGITAVLQELGFDGSEHIGQKKAKNREGGFPDIKIFVKGHPECGFGDTKATGSYQFPLGDTQKLGSYYHDCDQEFDEVVPCTYFLYIAGGFKQSQKALEGILKNCAVKFGRPVSAVTVGALLDLIESSDHPSVDTLEAKFKAGRLYQSAHALAE